MALSEANDKRFTLFSRWGTWERLFDLIIEPRRPKLAVIRLNKHVSPPVMILPFISLPARKELISDQKFTERNVRRRNARTSGGRLELKTLDTLLHVLELLRLLSGSEWVYHQFRHWEWHFMNTLSTPLDRHFTSNVVQWFRIRIVVQVGPLPPRQGYCFLESLCNS